MPDAGKWVYQDPRCTVRLECGMPIRIAATASLRMSTISRYRRAHPRRTIGHRNRISEHGSSGQQLIA
ncbi:hypothetical protein NS07_v2contig00051-0001 [Nocardia seriolae]|nr:hypothetical protein NS07_v2contig00051-0001 [Nocardia seriolae]